MYGEHASGELRYIPHIRFEECFEFRCQKLCFVNFQLTGQLGEVMQESAQAALSYIRANSDALGLSSNYYQNHDIMIINNILM